MKHTWVLRMMQVVLLTLSAYATGFGLREFLPTQTLEVGGYPWDWPLLVTIALVIVQTAGLWFCLEQALTRFVHWGARMAFFAMYLLFVTGSVAFAYGFWWQLIAYDDYLIRGLGPLVAEVEQRENSVDLEVKRLRSRSSMLRQEADAKRRDEVAGRGSCDNDKTPSPGRGGFALEREAVTLHITEVISSFEMELRGQQESLKQGIEKALSRAKALPAVADRQQLNGRVRQVAGDLNTAVNRYNGVMGSFRARQAGRLERIERALSPLTDGESLDAVVLRPANDEFKAPRRQCLDAELARAFSEMGDAVGALAEVRPLDVEEIIKTSPRKFAMWSLFCRAWETTVGAKCAGEAEQINYGALFWAALVDFLILVFGLLVVRRLIRSGKEREWLRDNFDDDEAFKAIKELVRDFSVVGERAPMLVLPTEGWAFEGPLHGDGRRRRVPEQNQESRRRLLQRVHRAVRKLEEFKVVVSSKAVSDASAALGRLGWIQESGEVAPLVFDIADRVAWDGIQKAVQEDNTTEPLKKEKVPGSEVRYR